MPAQDLIGLRGSFLGDIDPDAFDELIGCARVREVVRGAQIFEDRTERSTGVLLEGIGRAYLVGPDGRQLTLRYARPRAVITTSTTGAANHPLPVFLQAVTDVVVVDLDFQRLIDLQRSNFSVTRALAAEASRRLADVYRSFAATYYGTIKERLAAHLLDSAETTPWKKGWTMSAPVTQQDLAVALGSVREVVSRALQQLQADGIVELGRGSIDIIDVRRLIGSAGNWWMPSRAFALDGSSADGSFDASPVPVIAVDGRGEVVYANPAVADTFGNPPREVIGKPAARLLGKACAPQFERSINDLAEMQTGAFGLIGSYSGRRAGGAEFPIEITLMPVRAGGPTAAFASFVDLSYRSALRSLIERSPVD